MKAGDEESAKAIRPKERRAKADPSPKADPHMPKGRVANSVEKSPTAQLCKDNEKEADVDGQPTATFRKEWLTGGGQSTTANHSVTDKGKAAGDGDTKAPTRWWIQWCNHRSPISTRTMKRRLT